MQHNRVLALVRDVWPQAVTLLESVWQTPETVSASLLAVLRSSYHWTQDILHHIEVVGAPEQFILYLTTNDQVFFCSTQNNLINHPLLQEMTEELFTEFEEHHLAPVGMCLTAPLTEPLRARLQVPTVLLVSLFHPDMYPAARLTLGISFLASYLRQRHLAKVTLMDCQLGVTVRDVIDYVQQAQPDILGLSVNFGQFDLMEQVLDRIYAANKISKQPLVILGNILPAMCFREILKVYPQVVICRKEGELTLATLVKRWHERSRWNEVPGIYYLNEHDRLISTPARYLPLDDLPVPALDTVSELFVHDGVITAELSRGCQYNECSFCPRSHKGSIWRTAPVSTMLQHWEVFGRVFQHFGRSPHVFLADEDFVGREDGEATIRRITAFLDGAAERGLAITFDASCRADQIFREDRDPSWHIARGKLFRRCKEGGLTRLFVGVESGATAQLLRYNKGSTVEEMVSAIRYFSLLGIRLRFGFIFFDPLMSVQDMLENIEFLGRKDILLPPDRDASIEDIFAFVLSNHCQEIQQLSGLPVYEDVSYMVSPLEVLAKSRYHFEMQQQAPQMMSRQIDLSFARYATSYVVPEIGYICKACQYWVNYCFPIVYAVKGLQKVSQGAERALLHQAIVEHRALGYLLIRGLAEIFSLAESNTLQRWEARHPSLPGSQIIYSTAHRQIQTGNIDEAIRIVLQWYEEQIQRIMSDVNRQVSVLSASKREVWRSAYDAWSNRSLSEASALRTL